MTSQLTTCLLYNQGIRVVMVVGDNGLPNFENHFQALKSDQEDPGVVHGEHVAYVWNAADADKVPGGQRERQSGRSWERSMEGGRVVGDTEGAGVEGGKTK